MGFIYRYLKAVLWGAEEKSQTEENQGFGKDVEAWKEKEKKHRQDLADGLLEELKKKFEDTKTDLKKKNDSEKEKCEKKEKWGKRWWCKATAFIAYGVELTIAYVNHPLKLTLHPIVYSLTVAVAWISILVYWVARGIIKAIVWLLKGFLFLVHWVFRIAIAGFLIFVFPVALFLNVLQIFLNSPDLIKFTPNADTADAITFIEKIMAIELVAVSPIGINALALFGALSTQIVTDYIKGLKNNFKESFLPPDIRIGEGFIETVTILSKIAASMTELKGSLILLLGAALLVYMVSSDDKVVANDTAVNNNIYLTFENTIPPVVNHPDKKNDKDPFFTAWVLFPDEAKLDDWLNGKYAQGCHHSQDSQNAPNSGSCAVQPDKHFYKPIFRTILKWLSDEGSPEDKTRLEIVGFGSSSGVLASLKDNGNRDKATKKLQWVEKGQEKSCYERASSNGDQKLSNAFNLCMAESRARNVEDMLEDIIASIPAGHIELVRPEWDSYSEMCRQRGFSDTREEGATRCYDTDLGLMNRRVELRVTNLPKSINYSQSDRTPPSEGEAQMPTDSQRKTWYLGLCSLPHSSEAQMPPDPQGETCGQCASPVVCSRNPDITNQP